MKNKQKMDKSEPYFVHIGYTYAYELRKHKRYPVGKYYQPMKIRECVQVRLDKLNAYWKRSLK